MKRQEAIDKAIFNSTWNKEKKYVVLRKKAFYIVASSTKDIWDLQELGFDTYKSYVNGTELNK